MPRIGLATLLLVLLLAAPAPAMIGGQAQNPDPAWAVRIEIDNGASYCTGTVIAPTWILTAAHCLTNDRGAKNVAAKTIVRFRGRPLRAAALFPHPSYRPKKIQFGDIGLIQLGTDITTIGAAPATIGTADDVAYFRGRGVTVFGYGWDESGKISSKLRKSPDHAWKLGRACQFRGLLCFTLQDDFRRRTAIQGGDSGGPWMGWRNGGWRVLGVVNGFPIVDDDKWMWLHYSTSPADAAGWIAGLAFPPAPAAPAPAPGGPAPVPGGAAPAPQPGPATPAAPARVALVVDNRVTNGMGMREDATPARLTTQPWRMCTSRGCNIGGTERTSGGVFDAAVCQTSGDRVTNGHDTSPADDANPERFESTRYYGVRLADGTFGFISEVWIRADLRGGLGLPGC